MTNGWEETDEKRSRREWEICRCERRCAESAALSLTSCRRSESADGQKLHPAAAGLVWTHRSWTLPESQDRCYRTLNHAGFKSITVWFHQVDSLMHKQKHTHQPIRVWNRQQVIRLIFCCDLKGKLIKHGSVCSAETDEHTQGSVGEAFRGFHHGIICRNLCFNRSFYCHCLQRNLKTRSSSTFLCCLWIIPSGKSKGFHSVTHETNKCLYNVQDKVL